MSERSYFACPSGARKRQQVGPFASREEAIKAAFKAYPKAKEVTSGYGSEGPWFDVRWTRRDQIKGEE